MLGISLGLTARLNSSAFNPAVLFGLTDTGWVYDHSDFSTIFQDAAGTIPVTAVGQPVGLQLDKSRRLVPGPELVTNGTFDTDTAWAKQSNWSIGGGVATYSGTGADLLSQNIGAVNGRTYLIEWTSTAFVRFRLGSSSTNVFEGIGSRAIVGASGTDGTLYIRPPTAPMTIDNISVRELPGNHRTQSISLNRPTLLQDDGGLYYLSYDGINDSMATTSFAWGTDKATVVAGVRKLSDAAGARTIVETSTNSDSTNGTFRLGTDAATFTWRSRGTISANPSGAGAQPITAVLTGIGDIAGDVARLRRNAAQVGEVLTDQGTGNLLTYPAYFGARAGTSLFFNGREYSQFAINRLLTTDELAQIEAYTAGKTGVVL